MIHNESMLRFIFGLTILATMAGSGSSYTRAGTEHEKITFDDHVKPLLQKRCATCHNSERQSGGLDLTNFTSMMQGGSSGQSVEPGDPSGSYLYQLISYEESPEMPPGGNKIPDNEINLIAAWIEGGSLENSGSVATKKKTGLTVAHTAVGMRPESIAQLPRLSLQPFFQAEKPGVIPAIAIHPWTSIAAIATPRQILIFDTRRLELVGILDYPEGQANELRFSRNGELLLAGGGRHGLIGQVVLWDVATAERLMVIGDEVDNVLTADISPDHSLVALGGPQKVVRVYSSSDAQMLYEIKKHTDWITALEFSPDGVLLATADRSGGLHLWESDSGIEYLTLAGHQAAINDLSWRADANLLASAGDDGGVRLWEVENGQQVKTWTPHASSTLDVQFNRDGQILTCGRDPVVKLWQQDGKLIRQFEGLHEFGICLGYCEESQSVLAADFMGQVQAWGLADGRLLGKLDTLPLSLELRIQQAAARIASAEEDRLPIQNQLAQVEAQLATATEALATQFTLRNQIADQQVSLQSTLESWQRESEASAQHIAQWEHQSSELQAALPLIEQAAALATQASQLLPLDDRLRENAMALRQRYSQLGPQITALKNQVEQAHSDINGRQSQMGAVTSEVEQLLSQSAAAEQRVQLLQTELESIQLQKSRLTTESSSIQSRIETYQADLQRWQAELQFDRQLQAVMTRLQAARELASRQQQVVEQAEHALNEARAHYESRLQEWRESEAQLQTIESERLELRGRK